MIGNKRLREILHPLVPSPNGHNSRGLNQAETVILDPHPGLCVGDRDTALRPFSTTFPGTLEGRKLDHNLGLQLAVCHGMLMLWLSLLCHSAGHGVRVRASLVLKSATPSHNLWKLLLKCLLVKCDFKE